LRGHQGQVQPVELGAAHGHADHAAGVADHEGEQLGGGRGGREDDVALVLPVGVVHHDDRTALRDVLHGAVDVVEFLVHCPASRLISRSTYLPITSTCRFTVSPGCRAPMVVRLRVSGMRQTSNQESSPGGPTADTVRLMPSTAIEPLCTT